MHDALVAVLCWLVGGACAATAVWLMCESDARRTASLDGGPLRRPEGGRTGAFGRRRHAGRDVTSAQVRALLPRQGGPAD